MKALSLGDASGVLRGLRDEIRRSAEARYNHRLHGVLLMAQGMSGREVGKLLGDSPRTVQYWVRRFAENGMAGLLEGVRPGRPRRLSELQLQEVKAALGRSPEESAGRANRWDGKTLSAWIERRFGVSLGARQCQYLLRQLGFRSRVPRQLIAEADPPQRQKTACKERPELSRDPAVDLMTPN
ncbi:MAG: transposase [Candidatus Solibacter usitatus]|nr:transposase [Candidatus Solibacter usitatus]